MTNERVTFEDLINDGEPHAAATPESRAAHMEIFQNLRASYLRNNPEKTVTPYDDSISTLQEWIDRA